MKTSWKGIGAVDEAGGALLLMTLRQEYELIINPHKIDFFLNTLSALTEANQIDREVAFSWQLQFESLKTLIGGISEAINRGDFLLETPWQDLPSADGGPILKALRETFGSGVAVSVTGSAPVFTLNYRVGTLLLPRQLNMSLLQDYMDVLERLKNVDPQKLQEVLGRISTRKITAIEGLNELGQGNIDLTGGAMGGLAIALAADAVDLTPQLLGNNQIDSINVIPVPQILALAGAVGGLIVAVSQAYKAYEEAEKAKAERDKIKYEMELERQHEIERHARPMQDCPISAGGPAYDRDIERAASEC